MLVNPLARKVTGAAASSLGQAAKEALKAIAATCDYANSLDGRGFSKFDARIGHGLADWQGAYTDKQLLVALKLLRKYKGQIPGHLRPILLPAFLGLGK